MLEPLIGYLELAEKLWQHGPDYAEGWNFGPNDDDPRPVSWIVEHLATLWGQQARWVLDKGNHPHEAHYLKLDCSKAKMRLGWHPLLNLEQALSKTVEWYSAYAMHKDMRAVTLGQISGYEEC